jgi:serine/threonine protein kinase
MCCASPQKRAPPRAVATAGGLTSSHGTEDMKMPPPGMAHMLRWQDGNGILAAAEPPEAKLAVSAESPADAQGSPPDASDTGSGDGSLSGSGKKRSLSSRALSVVSRMTSVTSTGSMSMDEQQASTPADVGCAPCEVLAREAKARVTRLRQLNLSKQQVLTISIDMAKNIDVRDRKHMLRRYPLCFLGAEAVRWMLRQGHANTPADAVLLGRVMEDEGLLSHFFREHHFEDSQNFYVFLGPCAALVQPGSNACGSAAQLVFSTAEAAVAAAAAAEAACSTTPGCRLLRFLHEHDLEHLYQPLFQRANMDYSDVMLTFAQPEAQEIFIKLGLDHMQFAALQLAVSDSIDRRLEKLGRDPVQRPAGSGSQSTSEAGSKGSEPSRSASKGSDAGRGSAADSVGSSRPSAQDEEEQVRGLIEADANEGPAIRSWVIEDPAEIERENFIAEGTTGKVYRGQWQGMPVAVKVYKPGTLTEATTANAINEVQMMRRMQHQSLLRLYGACMTPPNLIIVSELCVGSLASLLYGRLSAAAGSVERLTPKWEYTFIKGIATGMAFLHKHNVAHRDLKSANVLFDRALMPKLCDFAFSKHKVDGRPADERQEQVEFSSAVGTPQWMAPEVLRGETYTTSADIWSFGVVVWEIKHRSRPYEGISAYAVSYKVASEGLRPVDNEALPQFWRKLMDDCFAQKADERPTFNAILQRLFDAIPPTAAREKRARATASSAVVATVSPRAGAAGAGVGAGAAISAVTNRPHPVVRIKSTPDRMVSTPDNSDEKEEKEAQAAARGEEEEVADHDEPTNSPASAPYSEGKEGGSWGTLGARGDTAPVLAPQRWESGQLSATSTALAMVLDARDARITRMKSTEDDSNGSQASHGGEEEQAPLRTEWFVSAGTGKSTTAAA